MTEGVPSSKGSHMSISKRMTALLHRLDRKITVVREKHPKSEIKIWNAISQFGKTYKLKMTELGNGASCVAYELKALDGFALKIYYAPIMGDNVPPMMGALRRAFLYPVWMGKHVMLQPRVQRLEDWVKDGVQVEEHTWEWWDEERRKLRDAVNKTLKRCPNVHWSDAHDDNVGMWNDRMYIIDWNYTEEGERPGLSPKVKSLSSELVRGLLPVKS